MNVHKNARLTAHSRGELARRVLVEGQAPMAVATAMGVTAKTVRKWVERFASEGRDGLVERSSRPHRLYRPPPEATAEQIDIDRLITTLRCVRDGDFIVGVPQEAAGNRGELDSVVN